METPRRRRLVDRRQFIQAAAGAMLTAGYLRAVERVAVADSTPALAPWPEMARFPGKTDLILQTDRPPNLETPLKYFREDLTPNDAFYVRWHLSDLPTRVDANRYRLTVGGHVENALSLSLDELRRNFERFEIIAVNQCSGNSRSKFTPRMPGVQWGNGALGNARWSGVRLRDLLAKAKVRANAVEVSFQGLDKPTLPAAPGFAGMPDFVKSLAFDRANDGEVMLAYEMNGQPLPMLNGFPLRLVVPGWYATYWVKALSEIMVLDKPFDGFWMAKAYRVPNTPGFVEAVDPLAKETVPITRMTVRSLFVRPEPDERVAADADFEVQGLALDGGSGIARVEISADSGNTWSDAKLDREIAAGELGKYSWRRWRYNWRPRSGMHQLMVRATNHAGETQPKEQWNRSGYARNVIESLTVNVA
jgi:DMSO/TMAO reductase YedYZ molybdopterin-dependent catalytic subunit